MKKLKDIIGVNPSRKGPSKKHDLSYAWYKSVALNRLTFTISLSNKVCDEMRYREGDRADILIDEETGTGCVKLSSTGDYAVSGKGANKTIKIASLEACEYLPRVFEHCESMRRLEIVSFDRDNGVTFKTAPSA